MSRPQDMIVSVLMPCHQHGDYLDEAIRSVREQTHRAWELAVVIDGDDPKAKAVAYEHSREDARVGVFVFKEQRGLPRARNHAAAVTSGSLLLPFDADDVMLPTFIEALVRRYVEAPVTTRYDVPHLRRVPVVFTPAIVWYGDDRDYVYRYPLWDRYKMAEQVLLPGCALHERRAFDTLHGFDPAWKHGATDWLYWCRLAGHDLLQPEQVQEPLWRYRQHSGFRNHKRGEAVIRQLRPFLHKAVRGQYEYGTDPLKVWN